MRRTKSEQCFRKMTDIYVSTFRLITTTIQLRTAHGGGGQGLLTMRIGEIQVGLDRARGLHARSEMFVHGVLTLSQAQVLGWSRRSLSKSTKDWQTLTIGQRVFRKVSAIVHELRIVVDGT